MSEQWSAVVPPVRGPAAIAMLCLRCLVVLAVVNGVIAFALTLGVVGEGAGGFYLIAVGFALLVAVVPTALVGYPAGLLTAHLLRQVERDWVHVVTFAAVGAVLAPSLMALRFPDGGIGVALGFAFEGAIGAGGGRWLSGRAHRRAAERGARAPQVEPEDALIDAQLALDAQGLASGRQE